MNCDQDDELAALEAIYESESFDFSKTETEVFGWIQVRLQLTSSSVLVCGETVSALPPVKLIFRLSELYLHPATTANGPENDPILILSAPWLPPARLQTLLTAAKAAAQNMRGSPVLHYVAQTISEEGADIMRLIGTHPDECTLNLDRTEYSSETDFKLAAQAIRDHNFAYAQLIFSNETIICGICLESKLGAKCHRFSTCRHPYCKPCLVNCFSIHIKEGNILQVSCPHETCKRNNAKNAQVLVPISEISDILSDSAPTLIPKYQELFDIHLMRQKSNLTYCPRKTCGTPTLKDPEEEKLCVCPKCQFAFCYWCNATWHGYASYCQTRYIEKVAMEYLNAASEQEKHVLEIKYGKKVLERVVREVQEEKLNSEWLKVNSQECPNCTVRVERSEGCCHMTCKVCGTHFCFLCGSHLDKSNPYFHFNTKSSSCYGKLFAGSITNDYDPMQDPELVNEVDDNPHFEDIPADIVNEFLRN